MLWSTAPSERTQEMLLSTLKKPDADMDMPLYFVYLTVHQLSEETDETLCPNGEIHLRIGQYCTEYRWKHNHENCGRKRELDRCLWSSSHRCNRLWSRQDHRSHGVHAPLVRRRDSVGNSLLHAMRGGAQAGAASSTPGGSRASVLV